MSKPDYFVEGVEKEREVSLSPILPPSISYAVYQWNYSTRRKYQLESYFKRELKGQTIEVGKSIGDGSRNS